MATTSTASDLSARLKQKTEEDASLSRSLILQEQGKLLSDLNRSYSEGLNTTLQGIQDALKSRLGQMALLTAQEAQTLEKMVHDLQTQHRRQIESFYAQSRQKIFEQVTPAKTALAEMTTQIGGLNAALATLQAQTKAQSRTARKSRLWSLLTVLSAWLIICAGSWGLIQYFSAQIRDNLAQIKQQQSTLEVLKNQTRGIDLTTQGGSNYVVFPENSKPQMGFQVGSRPAVKF
jgi:hypothetical protein